ncbi:MAG TPA: DUF5663 domain-containing protein [Dermatophilaceae bacterium]|jgi:hypothetical protein|nr:DUF5663 domain-containing protein [Dermatophilaceae bacterium]
MINIVESLRAVGIAHPSAELLHAFQDELEMRVGGIMSEFVAEADLEDFEALTDDQDEERHQWLSTHVGFVSLIVSDAVAAMVGEAKKLSEEGKLAEITTWPVRPPKASGIEDVLWKRGVRDLTPDELKGISDSIHARARLEFAEVRLVALQAASSDRAAEFAEVIAAVRAGQLPGGAILEYSRRLDGGDPTRTQRGYRRKVAALVESVVAACLGRDDPTQEK